MQEIRAKVVLIGSIGVGKTSLVERFVHQKFSNNYLSSIGVRVDSKDVQLNHAKVKLLIWDLAGEIYLSNQYKNYIKGAAGVMLVFDITRPDTYDNIKTVADDISKSHPQISVVIIANKSDLREDPQFKDYIQEGQEFDFLTSAKTGEEVELVFEKLSSDIYQNSNILNV